MRKQWGRWILDLKPPAGLCIELGGKRMELASLDDLNNAEHWQEWKELVIATTPGITAQDLEDIEKARREILEGKPLRSA